MNLSLFDAPSPRARNTDPDTSHHAAAKASGFALNHRNRIMGVLGSHTPKEIAALSGIDYVAVQRRMKELQELDLAHPTEGKRDGCRIWMRGPAP